MNKSAIRNFAVTARIRLKEQVRDKAAIYGITDKEIKKIELFGDGFRVGGKAYDKTILEQYRHLVKAVNQKGFNNVIEEVAYTWFNRFIALRFMEVNEYMPFNIHTKVLAGVGGKSEPEIVTASKDLGLVSEDLYYSSFDKGGTEGLYKNILINLCNKLSTIMPDMFEKISDYTELLIPDNLYTEGGIINLLVTSISEEDFTNQVEVIGWLYQFYISEKKAQVDEAVKKGKKVSKDDLPAKTQLFTPDWIVKYLVENSVGRLWLEKGDENSPVKNSWKYYLDGELKKDETKLSPEEIKIIDPACGSGHMLVYAFDVLYDIYVSCGYPENSISQLILENNLYGIDIDERAAQLTYFALIMKARSKNRRLFRKEERITVNVCAIKESNGITTIGRPDHSQLKFDDHHKFIVEYLIKTFNNAREYGSIIKVEPMDYDGLAAYIEENEHQGQMDLFDSAFINQFAKDIPDFIRQAKIMSQKYDVVVTNPPYLGKAMSPLLANYVKSNYPDSKSDLFTVFIERGFEWLKPFGYNSMVTMESWLFLSSYEKMREKLLNTKHIVTMCHMDDNVMGIAFGTTATIFHNFADNDYQAQYCYITMKEIKNETPIAFPIKNKRYKKSSISDFIKIQGYPIAYWASDNLIQVFEKSALLCTFSPPKTGMTTGDNSLFVRIWHEVNYNKIGFNCKNSAESISSGKKWFPYSKGGGFRKWYGLNENLVDWENNGHNIKNNTENGRKLASVRNEKFYFRKGITWSSVTNGNFSARLVDNGFLFDSGGSSSFPSDDNIYYILSVLISKISSYVLEIFNSTINFQPGDIGRIPIIESKKELVDEIVVENISISRADWDDFETSWDFKMHPLVKYKNSRVEEAYENWSTVADKRFNKLKSNEEELNRIFIETYGLQDELTPGVAGKDITVRHAEFGRDIHSLISYAVGCMFGRYSLDCQGLIYAGGTFDKGVYSTFIPDDDNIIIVTDQDYFQNDIVSRFIEFIENVYGSETLEENLAFIARALKPNSIQTARQIVREYFFNDFFEDHCKIYKKRPIYWQFETGPAGAMKALVYLHRIDEYTPARVRTDYLHPLMRAYEGEIKRIDQTLEDTLTAAERASYRKEKEDLQKKTAEIMKYDPVIAHIANQRIKFDLNDGVIVNYQKYQNVEVVEDGKASVTANLLTNI